MATISLRLTRLVQSIAKNVHASLAGKYSPKEYEDALITAFEHVDLNSKDMRADIARTFVRADIARRANVQPFKTDKQGALLYEVLSEKTFERGVIRLGDGRLVKMTDATAADWLARILHQQEAARAAQGASSLTTRWLQSPPGVQLVRNPDMKTSEAMYQLSFWPLNIDEDDDDDEEQGDDE